MINIEKSRIIKIFFILVFCFFAINTVSADIWEQQEEMMVGVDKVGGAFGEVDEPDDVRNKFVVIMKIVISFLALIFTLVIMWGGYTWMTSQGNQDKASEAKKWLTRGVIGVVVVLSALLIVTFVFNTSNSVLN